MMACLGAVAITRVGLSGVQPGDAVAVGLSSVRAEDDEIAVQLTVRSACINELHSYLLRWLICREHLSC